MKQHRSFALASVAACICVTGCDDGHLRGSVTPSNDGQTYLVVVNDNGGKCGPLLVDRKPWPHKIGEAGPISPGVHRIECGSWLEFEVPPGVIFKFDYWGP